MKRKSVNYGIKRYTAVFLTFCIFFSCCGNVFAQENENVFLKSSGSDFLKIEMEKISNGAFEIVDTEFAFHNQALRLNPSFEEGALTVNSILPKGDYRLWLRYSVPNGKNRIDISLQDDDYKTYKLPSTEQNTFKWILLSNQFQGTLKLKVVSHDLLLDALYITDQTTNSISNREEDFINDFTIIAQPSYNYPLPNIVPPASHPRVLFDKDDIGRIRKNMESEQGENAYIKYNEILNKEPTGILSGNLNNGTNRIPDELAAIEAKAFDYALNGNEESGRTAVTAIKNYLNTYTFDFQANSDYYYPSHTTYVASIVYDWCHALLSDEDKKEIVSSVQNVIGKKLNFGWPLSDKISAIGGFGVLTMILRDYLAFGIATYDEYPDIYNYVASIILNDYVPPRDYWYRSHSHSQGTHYGMYLTYADTISQWLFYAMSGKEIFNRDLYQIPYQFLYYYLPNGQHFREGDDDFVPIGTIAFDKNMCMLMATCMIATLNQDPYVKQFFENLNWDYATFSNEWFHFTPVQFFIMNDSSLESKPIAQLPKTHYMGSPYGMMVARTGWNNGINAPDVVATMKISEEYLYAHQHFDAGTFQIYYKGMLAPNLSNYARTDNDQYHNYNIQTISHNGLLIFDPNETMYRRSSNEPIAYSGGQKKKYVDGTKTLEEWRKLDLQTGEVIGYEYGPDTSSPAYSYLSGDITKAYTDKVSEVKRSMMFMPATEEFPAVFFVMDKIQSKEASFKKVFTLNAIEEPVIDGNVTTIQRKSDGYTGRLINQTLYPKNATIESIGGPGNQWLIGDKNFPAVTVDENDLNYGWGRVEISPSTEQKEDWFLNVMYVGDGAESPQLQKAELIETDQILGAKILNKITVFNKKSQRTKNEITFEAKGDEILDIAVCGLEKGEWTVLSDGKEITKQIATEDGGMIYFSAEAGNYTLNLTNPNAVKIMDYTPKYSDAKQDISLIVQGQYLYSDVSPVIKDDRTLIPLRVFFEKLGAEVVWDEQQKSAAIKKGDTTVILTEGSDTALVSGKVVSLDSPAFIINDRFMVPVRFLIEQFGGDVKWTQNPPIVEIDMDLSNEALWGLSKAEIIEAHGVENAEGTPEMTYDGNETTVWKAPDSGAWLTWELKENAELRAFKLFANYNTDRQYKFDLYASEDGESYQMVFSGETNGTGKSEIFVLEHPIHCKYIKFVGRMNSKTKWNNVGEIKFYVK